MGPKGKYPSTGDLSRQPLVEPISLKHSLAKQAKSLGVTSRQNHNLEASRLTIQVGGYAHAFQFRWVRGPLKSLRTQVGWVWPETDRNLDYDDETTAARAESILARVKRMFTEQPKDKKRLHMLACARSGMYLQGQAAPAVRIWRQSDGRHYAQGSGGHAPHSR